VEQKMKTKPIFSIFVNFFLLVSLLVGGFTPPVQAVISESPERPLLTFIETNTLRSFEHEGFPLNGRVVPGLAGLMVQALTQEGHFVARADTSFNGQFTFDALPQGAFVLRVLDQEDRVLKLTSEAIVVISPQTVDQEHLLYLELDSVGQPLLSPAETVPVDLPGTDQPVVQMSGYITGVVTAADTGLPIENVNVRAYGDNPNSSVDTDNTDSSGVYTLSVYLDTVYLYFDPPYNSQYAPEWYDSQVDYSTADPVNVSSGATVSNTNAVLEVGGQIIGQVTATEGGTPLSNVSVSAYYENSTGTHHVASTFTDGTGIYALNGLAAGTYYLEFDAPSNVNYVDEFYNNQPSLASADPLAVSLGATTPASAALETGAILDGTVTAVPGGAALSNVSVVVYTSTMSTSSLVSTSTNFVGHYEVLGLRAGTYYLKFNASYGSAYLDEFYNNQASLAEADPVAIASQAAVTINAALETGGTLTGMVTAVVGGVPLEDVTVTIYNEDDEYISSDSTAADGAYEVLALSPGSYKLRFSAPYNSAYLSEFYDNQDALETANLVSVTLNAVVQIDASLEKGGTLTGAVTAVVGSGPLENVQVEIYDEHADFFRSAYTDAAGVYTSTGLVAGDYFLYFRAPYNSGYLNEYHENKKSLAAADPVSVALNTTVTINADLDTGGTLTGGVSAEDGGAALYNARVRLFDSQLSPVGYLATEYTEVTGEYLFIGLEPGTYYLRFEPPFNQNYLKEYYNNQNTLAEADGISVALNTATSIDAELATGGILVGQVTALDTGLPLEDVWVDLYGEYNECGDDYIDSVSTNVNGVFTFTQLVTGIYNMYLDPSSFGNTFAYLEDGVSEISVTAGETTNQNVTLERGGQILGTLTGADTGLPLEDVNVRIYEEYETDEGPEYSYYGGSYTDENGVYTSTGLTSGEYLVLFDPAGETRAYLEEFYEDAESFETATEVSVTQGLLTTNINAVLTLGGQIMGQVKAEETGLPLEDVGVRVYTSTLASYSIAYGYTDENGVYTTTGLVAGDYFLLFDTEYGDAEDYINEYYNNTPSLAGADAVAVTLGNLTDHIDAELALGGKISGRVTAEDTGDGLYTWVDVFDAHGTWLRGDYTSSSGYYEIPGLPSGTYIVLFEGTYLGDNDECVNYDIEYEGRYYDQSLTFPSATPMMVVAPETTADIDGVLPLGSNQPPWPGEVLPVFLPVLLKP
jgi:hypothetical protein